MRQPSKTELNLLRGVARHKSMDHDDPFLAPYCSDDSTLTKPDVFNACHDMGWLKTWHDSDNSSSRVEITDAGRAALGLG